MTFTLAELAARVGGEVVGRRVRCVIERRRAARGRRPRRHLVLREREVPRRPSRRRARARWSSSRTRTCPRGPHACCASRNAYLAFAKISTLFHPPREALPDVRRQAFVHPIARVHPSAQVMPLASRRAGRGDRARARSLYPGRARRRGRAASARTASSTRTSWCASAACSGDRVILQPGCVIGVGRLRVRVRSRGRGGRAAALQGARRPASWSSRTTWRSARTPASIARRSARRGSAAGAKIDNLVQIAHNVEVGPLCLIVSQVGIAGSTKLGMGVVAAGRSGSSATSRIGDGAKIARPVRASTATSSRRASGRGQPGPAARRVAAQHRGRARPARRSCCKRGRASCEQQARAGWRSDDRRARDDRPGRRGRSRSSCRTAPPFLLVDRVVELEPGKRLVGVEERDDERAVLRRPLPGEAGDAGRAHPGGARAGARAPRDEVDAPDEQAAEDHLPHGRSTARGSAGRSSPATASSCTSR